MLLNIHVKNFALIDEAELDLGPGFNVLTGETGAGKSILIDAVSAALGARMSSDVIGSYGDSAYIELVFSVNDKQRAALAALDVDTDYDCIIISRRIYENRSIHKINDETVTGAKVRAVTELLIDIHGQHEHQSLVRPAVQLEILDRYSENDTLRGRVSEAYRAYHAALKSLEEYAIDDRARSREMDLIKYEIQELEQADVKPGEEEDLSDTYKRFNNSSRLAEDVSKVLEYLDDGRSGAGEQISSAIRYAASIAELDGEAAGFKDSLEQIQEILTDTLHELHAYSEELDYDPEELRRTERRLDEIHHLEQKYGQGYEALTQALESRRQRLEELSDFDNRRAMAETRAEGARQELDSACETLSKARWQQAGPISEAITAALRELNFLDIRFKIDFSQSDDYTPNGRDQVCYMISTNPGEPLRPMGEVASGGELSRIMLGIKAVLADKDEIPTLIFDEIDTGISGRTAHMVAEKIARIAMFHQVICITHLPQIAAFADEHFAIEKAVRSGRTLTCVRSLDGDGQIEELARLLGGGEISAAACDNAAELKKKANNTKETLI